MHYDALAINRNIAIDLPFREGAGVLTHSIARTKPVVQMVGAPAPWSILDSGLPFLTFSGVNEYVWASAADTLNMDFTSDDYSLGGWFRIDSGERDDKTLMCRFQVHNTGWELYHYTNLILTLRHHHTSQGAFPSPLCRSSCYSENWAYGNWYYMGFSRHGATGQFWRGDINGFAALPMFYSPLGLVDPDTCPQNFFVGTDLTGVNDYKGGLWRPRTWFDRYITEIEHQQIWEKEVEWFRS